MLAEPGCAQKDAAVRLLERILAADLAVYASQVYCWSFPAQLKALLDRHYCLVKWQDGEVAAALMADKHVVANCATPMELTERAGEMGRRMTHELAGG